MVNWLNNTYINICIISMFYFFIFWYTKEQHIIISWNILKKKVAFIKQLLLLPTNHIYDCRPAKGQCLSLSNLQDTEMTGNKLRRFVTVKCLIWLSLNTIWPDKLLTYFFTVCCCCLVNIVTFTELNSSVSRSTCLPTC